MDLLPDLNVVVTPKSLDAWCLRIQGMLWKYISNNNHNYH